MTNQPIKIIIIAADFHQVIADNMIKAAKKELINYRANLLKTIRVPGCYEIPLAAQTIIQQSKPDCLVILGYIERGYTMHGEIMGHVVLQALVSLQLKHNMPMGLGIIGPGATLKQAKARWESTARGAVRAALSSHQLCIKEGRS
jgi:6,7-dimethyl-8-ribityllumazine synthase